MKIEATIEKLKNSEIEITGSIPFEELEKSKVYAVKKMGEDVKVDGFRKGHVPETILKEKLGEMAILNEMAEITLQSAYPQIMEENKIDAIGSPQITITKLAPSNPMEFKIKIVVMPEVGLPNYKKLAKEEMSKKEEEITVTDEEVTKTIKQLQQSQKQQQAVEAEETISSEDKDKLPELTDEFVKKLGDFKDVADFKMKLKENIRLEKTHKAREMRRLEILNDIAKETKVELPEILIEAELRKMIAQMKDDISRMGLQFDKYLEHIKKKEDDLRKEWRTDAENRVKTQMILNQISIEEKITPSEEEVIKNTEAIMKQHKDAKKENVDVYVKMMLTNDEVFKLLENQ